MKRMTVRMKDELAEKLEASADKNERSLHGEIITALEEYVRVPIIGKVKADGTVEMDADYWNTEKGIEQLR